MLYELFHTDYFRITVTKDASTVEICGALKVRVLCIARACLLELELSLCTLSWLCVEHCCRGSGVL